MTPPRLGALRIGVLRAALVALLAVGGCAFSDLTSYEIASCDPTVIDLDHDACNRLNSGKSETCQVWQCDSITLRCALSPKDFDRDGDVAIECGGHDCNDRSRAMSSMIREVCDGIDNDCDGVIDGPAVCTGPEPKPDAAAQADASIEAAVGADASIDVDASASRDASVTADSFVGTDGAALHEAASQSDGPANDERDAQSAEAGDAVSQVECTQNTDCALPATLPAGCAEAVCAAGTCTLRSRDADNDGHRAMSCTSVGISKPITVGDDCNDDDANVHPGATQICDGTDRTCGTAAVPCTCVNGTAQSCYSGPAGTAGVAACKVGSQQCSGGVWGPCVGQVLPALTANAPPDAAHPCDGTNYWCDPAGVLGSHCPECLTTSAPQACGSATTCNASATKTCALTGLYGSCAPAAVTTCAPGTAASCTTCSGLPLATSGSHICTASCNFSGARCTPPGSTIPVQLYPGNVIFSHQSGSATNPANPAYWESKPSDSSGYMVYGPYVTLPAGHYRVTFSFYGAPNSSDAVLDVVRNGVCGGADGGLCPVTVNPSANGATSDYTYDFDILADCSDKWEIRVNKTSAAELYLYVMYLYYVHP